MCLCDERRAGRKRGTGAATGVCFEGSSVARGREEKGGGSAWARPRGGGRRRGGG
jgi:hypothetical protein